MHTTDAVFSAEKAPENVLRPSSIQDPLRDLSALQRKDLAPPNIIPRSALRDQILQIELVKWLIMEQN